MVKKTTKKYIDRINWKAYQTVARSFYGGAEVAKEYEYWNASGVLIIHAGIAYSDAICIKYGGVKSQGEDHNQVISLLKEILSSSDENRKSFQNLEKMIAHKNSVSYSGDVYEAKDINLLWKHLERFKTWAEDLLKR